MSKTSLNFAHITASAFTGVRFVGMQRRADVSNESISFIFKDHKQIFDGLDRLRNVSNKTSSERALLPEDMNQESHRWDNLACFTVM